MESLTWKTQDGRWKGQLVSEIVKGETRYEIIEKLKLLNHDASVVLSIDNSLF